MLWMLLLAALGLSALWFATDSTESTEVSEEELLARYAVTWELDDPSAYMLASELAAARLTARAQGLSPARSLGYSRLYAHSR